MKLNVILPAKTLFSKEITKLIAEGVNGSFCLLPRHIDFVSALKESILTYQLLNGEEEYLAHTSAILVKCKENVYIATKYVLESNSLGDLQRSISEKFQNIEAEEKKTKTFLTQMETEFVERFLEIKK